jgi:hypothetical protein
MWKGESSVMGAFLASGRFMVNAAPGFIELL